MDNVLLKIIFGSIEFATVQSLWWLLYWVMYPLSLEYNVILSWMFFFSFLFLCLETKIWIELTCSSLNTWHLITCRLQSTSLYTHQSFYKITGLNHRKATKYYSHFQDLGKLWLAILDIILELQNVKKPLKLFYSMISFPLIEKPGEFSIMILVWDSCIHVNFYLIHALIECLWMDIIWIFSLITLIRGVILLCKTYRYFIYDIQSSNVLWTEWIQMLNAETISHFLTKLKV